jgi:cysteinyl-tRNA synthetase
MSKSLGNVIKIRDFVEKYHGQVLRHIYLSVHYRARLEWSEEVLQRSIDEVKRIHEFVTEVKSYKSSNDGGMDLEIEKCIDKMWDEILNDFNSAGAMGHFFSFIRYVRLNKNELSHSSLQRVKETIGFVKNTLGLVAENPEEVLAALKKGEQDIQNSGIDISWIEKLIEERKSAKSEKNWSRADEIRKELSSKGIVLKDNPDGSTSWVVQS